MALNSASATQQKEDVPVDFRFLGVLLRVANDTEGLGKVRTRGQGWTRRVDAALAGVVPIQTTLELPEQADPLEYHEHHQEDAQFFVRRSHR